LRCPFVPASYPLRTPFVPSSYPPWSAAPKGERGWKGPDTRFTWLYVLSHTTPTSGFLSIGRSMEASAVGRSPEAIFLSVSLAPHLVRVCSFMPLQQQPQSDGIRWFF